MLPANRSSSLLSTGIPTLANAARVASRKLSAAKSGVLRDHNSQTWLPSRLPSGLPGGVPTAAGPWQLTHRAQSGQHHITAVPILGQSCTTFVSSDAARDRERNRQPKRGWRSGSGPTLAPRRRSPHRLHNGPRKKAGALASRRRSLGHRRRPLVVPARPDRPPPSRPHPLADALEGVRAVWVTPPPVAAELGEALEVQQRHEVAEVLRDAGAAGDDGAPPGARCCVCTRGDCV